MRRFLASLLAAAVLAASVQTAVFADDTAPADGNDIAAADTVDDGQQPKEDAEPTDTQEPQDPQAPEDSTEEGTDGDLGEADPPSETDGGQIPDDSQAPEDKPNEDNGQETEPPADKDNSNEGGEQNPDGDKPTEDEKPAEGEDKLPEGEKPAEGEDKTPEGEKPAEGGGEKLPDGEKKPTDAELPKQDGILPEEIGNEPQPEYFEDIRAVPDVSGSEPDYLETFTGKTGLQRVPRASSSIVGFYGQQLSSFGRIIYEELYKVVSNPQSLGVRVYHDPVEYSFKIELTAEQVADEMEKAKAIENEFNKIRSLQIQSVFDSIGLDHSDKFFWVKLGSGGGEIYSSFVEFTLESWDSSTKIARGKVSFDTKFYEQGYNLINLAIEDYYGSTLEDVQTVLEKLEEAIKAFPATGKSRYDKVKTIHDELAKQVAYNHENMSATEAHDPTGALFSPYLAVCEGYAKAFKAVCNANGIPCELGWGDAGGAHMWNYVQMDDGNWYPVDVTWDDQPNLPGGIIYDYFLIGNEEFKKDHTARSNYTNGIDFKYPGPISDTEYDPTAPVVPTYSLFIEGDETVTVKAGYTEPPEFSFDISNTGTGALSVTLVLDNEDVFTLSKNSLSLDGGAAETVTVTAATGKEIGTYQAVLTVSDEEHEISETKTFTLKVIDKSLVTFTGEPKDSTSVYNGQSQEVSLNGITAQAEDGTKFTEKDFTVTYAQEGSAASGEMRNAGKYIVTVHLDTTGYTGETTFIHTITPVALALTAKATDREYDGTKTVAVETTLSGVLGSDDVKADPASVPTTGTMEDQHGGKDKKVTIDLSKVVLTGEDAANYTLEGVTSETTVTISPKPIEFHIYAEPKVYDGNTNAKFRAEFIGLIDGDRIPTVEAEANFKQADVGNNISITTRNIKIILDAHFKDNYDYGKKINLHGADITPKPVTVTFGENEFTYDGSPKPMTAVYTDVKGEKKQASLTYGSGNTTAPTKAGTYTVTASIPDTNYELTGEKTASMTIAAGKLTFSGSTITIRRGSTDPVTAQLAVNAPTGSAAPKGKFEIESISDPALIDASITENGLLSVSLKPEVTASSEIKVRFVPEEGTYESASASITVNVKDFKAVDTIKGNPTEVKFGEKLPAMQVVCEYDFGGGDKQTKTLDITEDMIQGYDSNKLGEQKLILTIKDNGYTRTLEFQVTVVDFAKSIAVKTEPGKKGYTLNQDKALDLTGGTAVITMASGAEKDVSLSAPEITCTGFISGIVGNQEISVTYKDQFSEITAENGFTVTVSSKVAVDAPEDNSSPSVTLGKDTKLENEDGDEVEPDDVSLVVGPVDSKDQEAVDEVINKEIPKTMETMPVEIRLETTTGDVVQPNGSITIRLPFPEGTNRNYTFSLYHIKDGKGEKVNITISSNGILFTVTSLSPFVLAWKAPESKPETPSRPGSSVSYDDDDEEETLSPAQREKQEETEFWDDVENNVYRARRGDTLRIEMGGYNVPARVMNALAERSGLTVIFIDEDDNKVTIPSDQIRRNALKLAYSMSDLMKLYANISTDKEVTKLNAAGTANAGAPGTGSTNTQNGSYSVSGTNPNTGAGDVIQIIAPQSAFKDPEKGIKVISAPTAPTGAVYEKESTDSKEAIVSVQTEETPVQEKSGSRLPAALAVAAALLCAAGLVWKFGFLDGKFRNLRK